MNFDSDQMIEENYKNIKKEIAKVALQCGRKAEDVHLLAVIKNQSIDKALQLYKQGCRDFGENRLQEALPKIAALPKDIRWHFIGTLQKNKIKAVIENFNVIHSVDTPELAKIISEQGRKLQKNIDILIQVNTSGEASKQGLDPAHWNLAINEVVQFKWLNIKGLMTLAPFTDNLIVIRACFRRLAQLKDEWNSQFDGKINFSELSMGMSNDFPVAIEEGSTWVRIGTSLFV